MLINPLKVETNDNAIQKLETDKDAVISEIISYLIGNYSEYLSDISINKPIVENIVREKVYKEYTNLNSESTIVAILDRLFGYHILQKYIDNTNVTSPSPRGGQGKGSRAGGGPSSGQVSVSSAATAPTLADLYAAIDQMTNEAIEEADRLMAEALVREYTDDEPS